MKITIFLISAFLGAFIMSCQKDNLDPSANTDFASVMLSAARYSVEADSTTKRHCKGKITELAEADIPAAVSAYIVSNYAGATIKHAGKNEAEEYFVLLATADKPVVLLFNANGTFAKALEKPNHGGKRFGPGRHK